jgi:hypothetical protein
MMHKINQESLKALEIIQRDHHRSPIDVVNYTEGQVASQLI